MAEKEKQNKKGECFPRGISEPWSWGSIDYSAGDVIRSDAAILNTEVSAREVDMTSKDVW